MNWGKIYNDLVSNALSRGKPDEYFERHHIIPSCMNGENVDENKVYFTAREHFIAHALLAKIYKNTEFGYKLCSAFNKMCSDGQQGRRYKSILYSMARKMYSENHPCKNEEIKEKIRNGLKKTRSKEGYVNTNKMARETRFCECGCEETFIVIQSSKKRFINGHQIRVRTDEKRKSIASSLKNTLKNQTPEQKIERYNNSYGKCDQVKRGEAISLGKKGKKTNQYKISSKRYGEMTEIEFENHLHGRPEFIQTRFKNMRKRYLNENVNTEIQE